MSYTKVTDEERAGKGVSGLPDVPQLSTSDMQAKFDELGNVGIDALNNLIDELEATSGANSLGIEVPSDMTADPNVGSVIAALNDKANALVGDSHIHLNKDTLDNITSTVKAEYDRLVGVFQTTNTVNNGVLDDPGSIPTGHAIVQYVSALGGGDMLKATYDADGDGVVDSAKTLQGHEVTEDSSDITNPTVSTGTKIPTASAVNAVYQSLDEKADSKISKDSIATELSTATNTVPATGLLKQVNDSLSNSLTALADIALKQVAHFSVSSPTSSSVQVQRVNLTSKKLYVFFVIVHKITEGERGANSGSVGIVTRYMDLQAKKVNGQITYVDKIINTAIISRDQNSVMTNYDAGKYVTVQAKVGYWVDCTVYEIPL